MCFVKLFPLSVAPGVARQRMQRIILLVVRSSTAAIVVGRVARVYSSSGEYLSLAPSSGELLAREALLLVTGPVLELALMGTISCHAAPTAHLVTRRGKVGTR